MKTKNKTSKDLLLDIVNLREALKFYADKANYTSRAFVSEIGGTRHKNITIILPILFDGGQRARDILREEYEESV